jgi:hypothetical protein
MIQHHISEDLLAQMVMLVILLSAYSEMYLQPVPVSAGSMWKQIVTYIKSVKSI